MKRKLQKPFSPVIPQALSSFVIFIILSLLPGILHAQWNPNTSVNLQISGLIIADMQSVSTRDGKTWVAFYNQNGSNYDMRAQLIDANGYKLLGPDGILIDNKPSGSYISVFNVCVDSSNNLIIGFQDERSGSDQAVVYKISEAGAELWGSNGIVLGEGLAPYPAALSNGEVVISWEGMTNNTLNLQKITTSGTIAWTPPKSILIGSSVTTRGQVIANTAGKFTVVYQKRGTGISSTLYAQMFDNSGTAFYAPVQISNQTTSAARYYSIVAEEDTTYFGYYSSVGFRFNSFLQRINPGGTIPWGMNGSHFNTSVGTNDNYQGQTDINMTPGSDYVWSLCTFSDPNQTIYGVYIQKFLKTTGARQFTDQAKVVYPVSSNSYTQAGNLALAFDTPMFMAYVFNYKIYATRLDANGNFIWPGNKVEISSTTATASNGKYRFGFTPDGPNRCAGIWIENRGAGYLGYAQGISIGGLVGLTITTQGGVPATITANGGTLQLVATVYPSSANQHVTWSIVPGTGMASIDTAGLVTAISNGTAYAVATAVQDTTVNDSLMITMSGQTAQPPAATTLPATDITSSGATLNGTVNANTLLTNVYFDWGLTSSYGNTADATPSTVTGSTDTPVLVNLGGLTSNTTYHFRVKASNAAGLTTGTDLTFTTSWGVGIHEKAPLNVEINPNPNDGHFNLSLSSETATSYKLTIYNNLGIRIYSSPVITITGTTVIPADLGSAPSGLYTLILSNNSDQVVRKILVNK